MVPEEEDEVLKNYAYRKIYTGSAINAVTYIYFTNSVGFGTVMFVRLGLYINNVCNICTSCDATICNHLHEFSKITCNIIHCNTFYCTKKTRFKCMITKIASLRYCNKTAKKLSHT